MSRKRKFRQRKLNIAPVQEPVDGQEEESLYLFPVDLVKKDLLKTIWLTMGMAIILLGLWWYL